MLKTIRIKNYKSIEDVLLPLGRTNVFIGENGAGKSNILEAIALAGAARAHKLDNEFLASRGIRVSAPQLMRAAFNPGQSNEPITVSVELHTGEKFDHELTNDNEPYSTWQNAVVNSTVKKFSSFTAWVKRMEPVIKGSKEREKFRKAVSQVSSAMEKAIKAKRSGEQSFVFRLETEMALDLPFLDTGGIEDFIIYAPENSALRMFEREGQIEPLGINGEGLLKLLRVMSSAKDDSEIKSIKDSLRLFNWFQDIRVGVSDSRDYIEIVDQYFDESSPCFDQRSANEGFLFVAFYLALFTTKLTPRFFAVDNVDSSLNPRLCEALMRLMANLANVHSKQVILTTHNPAILDGLNLSDPEQRLFVVSRGVRGQTRIRRFEKKPSDKRPRRLSELFLSGALGGLSKGF